MARAGVVVSSLLAALSLAAAAACSSRGESRGSVAVGPAEEGGAPTDRRAGGDATAAAFAAGGDSSEDGDGDFVSVGGDPVSDEGGDLGDAGGGDGDADAGDGGEVIPPPPVGHSGALYAADRTHSPITAEVRQALRNIVARDPTLNDDMFMKVGDSITEGYAVMSCFAGAPTDIVLDGRAHLQPAIDLFRAAYDPGPSPCDEAWCRNAVTAFNRRSYAARGGEVASYPLTGAPTPLQQEHGAIKPRYALVQFGTNDATLITSPAALPYFESFYTDMLTLTDALAQQGIVPILYTIPPYKPPRNGHFNPPTMNAIVRAIAQGRRVPLVDYYRELLPLSDWGLWDGVHPRVEYGGCNFTSAGLLHGYNVRNLISMEALARATAALRDDQPPPDATAPTLPGQGTADNPLVIASLPFADLRAPGGTSSVSAHPGCGVAGLSGADVHYRLTLASPQRLRFLALDRSGVEERVTVVQGDSAGGTCLGSHPLAVQLSLPAGTYRVVIDSAAGEGGEYALVVIGCEGDDPACG